LRERRRREVKVNGGIIVNNGFVNGRAEGGEIT
jgi:hypothetical protein